MNGPPHRAPLETGSPEERSRAIQHMFGAIAPRYDLLNRLLSLTIDRIWRRRAVDRLGWESRPDGTYLDLCAGTFDLALELARRKGFRGRVVAADFAVPMLLRGRPKIEGAAVLPVCADALRPPFAAAGFDGAMVAFGVRNLADIDSGLRELRRVLRPGACLVVLDFAMPRRQPLRSLYRLYFTRLLPTVGRLISKHSYAYRYLPESVLRFARPDQLASRMAAAGFAEVDWQPLTGGVACIWKGSRE